MLSNAEINALYILRDEKERHETRQNKEEVEYRMVLHWLKNRIRELETRNEYI